MSEACGRNSLVVKARLNANTALITVGCSYRFRGRWRMSRAICYEWRKRKSRVGTRRRRRSVSLLYCIGFLPPCPPHQMAPTGVRQANAKNECNFDDIAYFARACTQKFLFLPRVRVMSIRRKVLTPTSRNDQPPIALLHAWPGPSHFIIVQTCHR